MRQGFQLIVEPFRADPFDRLADSAVQHAPVGGEGVVVGDLLDHAMLEAVLRLGGERVLDDELLRLERRQAVVEGVGAVRRARAPLAIGGDDRSQDRVSEGAADDRGLLQSRAVPLAQAVHARHHDAAQGGGDVEERDIGGEGPLPLLRDQHPALMQRLGRLLEEERVIAALGDDRVRHRVGEGRRGQLLAQEAPALFGGQLAEFDHVVEGAGLPVVAPLRAVGQEEEDR
ncbi:MAG: hypothetical protein AVDCRST_MAG88-4577, partial [uncultured Thermomicrobiales bacterium]